MSTDPGRARLTAAQAEFSAETIYLNTATLGLPCRATSLALDEAITEWRTGRTHPAEYDRPLASSRATYAALVGVDPSWVAVGSQASVFAGLVAAALPPGSEVLLARGEFASVVFPFLAQAGHGITVRQVELTEIAGAITPHTSLVAVAAVQSADGRLADLDAIVAACARTGTQTFIDTTQAAGWLPIDASRYDYTVCSGYKWLLAPRGTCFFTVAPARWDELTPQHAGWYAGEDPWASIYAETLTLASNARRFDLSPAWQSWVGQAPALELLASIGPAVLHEHAVGLANRFRAAVELAPADSAIVSVAMDESAHSRLEQARIMAGVRAGRLRLAFHVNNSVEDADAAAAALRGYVRS